MPWYVLELTVFPATTVLVTLDVSRMPLTEFELQMLFWMVLALALEDTSMPDVVFPSTTQFVTVFCRAAAFNR